MNFNHQPHALAYPPAPARAPMYGNDLKTLLSDLCSLIRVVGNARKSTSSAVLGALCGLIQVG